MQKLIKEYADKVLDRVDVKNDYHDSYTASKVLREELKDAAHHLTPWNDSRAEKAQKILKEFRIDHDSAANGVFLSYKVNEYVVTEVLHIGNHSSEYILEVERV
ncbi:AHH domain-containing protein [Bacillus sp. dmp10]|uniref:AHH domain-containing protein n=1 Tax=Bacillus sp. dmp10 TaxID=2293321 RepID=UPI000E2FD188|nr:hypothetical protein DZB83_30955 [Bacillus sp. dmp10]